MYKFIFNILITSEAVAITGLLYERNKLRTPSKCPLNVLTGCHTFLPNPSFYVED